jgi:hypothetical protein
MLPPDAEKIFFDIFSFKRSETCQYVAGQKDRGSLERQPFCYSSI